MTGWSWLCFDSSVQSPQTSWCIYQCIAFCREEEEAYFYNGWLWMGTRTRWGEIEVKCSWNPCKWQNLLAMERGCEVIICATHGSLCISMDWRISGIAEILVSSLAFMEISNCIVHKTVWKQFQQSCSTVLAKITKSKMVRLSCRCETVIQVNMNKWYRWVE
jgi:hypothetical protein